MLWFNTKLRGLNKVQFLLPAIVILLIACCVTHLCVQNFIELLVTQRPLSDGAKRRKGSLRFLAFSLCSLRYCLLLLNRIVSA
jgi:hypothetical protein